MSPIVYKALKWIFIKLTLLLVTDCKYFTKESLSRCIIDIFFRYNSHAIQNEHLTDTMQVILIKYKS